MPFLVMVWHVVKDVLLTFSTSDTIPVLPGNIHTLFFAINGLEMCCLYNHFEVLSCHAESCASEVHPNTILYGHSESQTNALI